MIDAAVVRARSLTVLRVALTSVSAVRRMVAGLALARRRVNDVARRIDVVVVVAGVRPKSPFRLRRARGGRRQSIGWACFDPESGSGVLGAQSAVRPQRRVLEPR